MSRSGYQARQAKKRRGQRRKPVRLSAAQSPPKIPPRATWPKYASRRLDYAKEVQALVRRRHDHPPAPLRIYLSTRVEILDTVVTLRSKEFEQALAGFYSSGTRLFASRLSEDDLRWLRQPLDGIVTWCESTGRLPALGQRRVHRPAPPTGDVYAVFRRYLKVRTKLNIGHSLLLSVDDPFDLTDLDVARFDAAQTEAGYAVEYDLADLWELADRAVRTIKLMLGESGGLDYKIDLLRNVTEEHGCTPGEAENAQRLAAKLEQR